MLPDEAKIFGEYQQALKIYARRKQAIDLNEVIADPANCVAFRLEDSLPKLNYTIPPHRSLHLGIIYVKQGSGFRIVGNTRIPMAPGTLLLIPHKALNSGAYTTGISGYYLGFTRKLFLQKDCIGNFARAISCHSPVALSAELREAERTMLTALFESILDERDHDRISKNEMISLKIMQLIICCRRIFNLNTQVTFQNIPETIHKLLNLVNENYRSRHAPAFYAAELNLHPNGPLL